jgi:hypothetical protein
MAAIDDHASQKPHHTGDLDATLWGIEKDPLLRQTIMVVVRRDAKAPRALTVARMLTGLLAGNKTGQDLWS